MNRIRLILGYFHPWTNDAGFYLARERGWYDEAGIDLEIAVVDPGRGDTLAHLIRGDADFGVFPSNRLLVRREQGQSIIGVAAINHGGLESIQAVASRGITRPRDLSGRRIGFAPTPRGVALVRHLIAHDGGDPDSIEIIDTGRRELTVDDIATGAVDATFGGYWSWDALFGTLPESQRITWRVDDIGAPPFHSYLLGTNQTLIGSDPDLVRRFLTATARGYQAVIDDPVATLAVLETVIPYFPRSILARSLALVRQTWLHAGRWGEQREALLAPYAQWLASHRILEAEDTWRHAATNALLPSHTTAVSTQ